jgi:SAM-dependent methyltransferase
VSSCCSTRAIADQFGRETAQEELSRYRSDGPLPTTGALIEALVRQGVADAELLDVGAGVGAIHIALLGRGAKRATHVDISPHYVNAARDESTRQGHSDRVRFVVGDFVELAPDLESADVVTLDRVICCYPDMERLVTRSAEKARRLYGAVYPRDRWWAHVGVVLMNVWKRLTGSAFRSYLHSQTAIDSLLSRLGFERRSTERTWFWEVAVYRREHGPKPVRS